MHIVIGLSCLGVSGVKTQSEIIDGAYKRIREHEHSVEGAAFCTTHFLKLVPDEKLGILPQLSDVASFIRKVSSAAKQRENPKTEIAHVFVDFSFSKQEFFRSELLDFLCYESQKFDQPVAVWVTAANDGPKNAKSFVDNLELYPNLGKSFTSTARYILTETDDGRFEITHRWAAPETEYAGELREKDIDGFFRGVIVAF